MAEDTDGKTVLCDECDRRRFVTGAVKCARCGQGNVHCSRMFADISQEDRICEACLAEQGVRIECRRTKKKPRAPTKRSERKHGD